MARIIAYVLLSVVALPGTAHAYVDPGVLGILYQAAYALLVGGMAALILRPWRYLRGLFGRAPKTKNDQSRTEADRQ